MITRDENTSTDTLAIIEKFVAFGPWRLTTNCKTAFGRWCVSRAGRYAFKPE